MAFKKEGKFGAKKAYGKPSRFGASDRPSGGRSFGTSLGGRSYGKPTAGGRSGGKFELFDARCEKCGKDCQVPFKPVSGKPIYCRDCFTKGGDDASPRRSGPSSGGSSDDLRDINRKLDKIMRALKIE